MDTIQIKKFRGRGAKTRATEFAQKKKDEGYDTFKGKSDPAISQSGWIVGYTKQKENK